MASVKVGKLDAAQRQTDTAIKMLFESFDPLAVYTVTAAANQIIRDICNLRGDVESYLRFTDWIAPGHEREFWGYVNKTANFLKHADKDPEDEHEFNDQIVEFMLLFCCMWLRDLIGKLSYPERVFCLWLGLCRPSIVKISEAYQLDLDNLPEDVSTWDRMLQLKLGRHLLALGEPTHNK